MQSNEDERPRESTSYLGTSLSQEREESGYEVARELTSVAQQTCETLINSHRNFEHVQS